MLKCVAADAGDDHANLGKCNGYKKIHILNRLGGMAGHQHRRQEMIWVVADLDVGQIAPGSGIIREGQQINAQTIDGALANYD